jgi:hypothetical protein
MEEFLKKYLGKKNQKSSFKLYRIFLENNSNKKNNLLLAKESREGEDYFKNEDQRIKEEERRILTYYFDKQPISDPDSENFFGNGILLHKLRTSPQRALLQRGLIAQDAGLRAGVGIPSNAAYRTVSRCLSCTAGLRIWLLLWFKEKIFVSKAIFLATLVCDTSSGIPPTWTSLPYPEESKAWPAGASGPLQFGGAGLLLLSCLFGVRRPHRVCLDRSQGRPRQKKRCRSSSTKRKKRKDQQEESMIKLRDEEGQKSQAVEPSPEPMGLMDRRALSPFWRLKFKKASAPDDQTLKRPDLQLV